jgi:hypothetical protein
MLVVGGESQSEHGIGNFLGTCLESHGIFPCIDHRDSPQQNRPFHEIVTLKVRRQPDMHSIIEQAQKDGIGRSECRLRSMLKPPFEDGQEHLRHIVPQGVCLEVRCRF